MSHPAVDLARAAAVRGSRLIQFTLTLAPHTGPQPGNRMLPTRADDINLVLNEVAAYGWELVTASVLHHAESTAIGCVYVFRRA